MGIFIGRRVKPFGHLRQMKSHLSIRKLVDKRIEVNIARQTLSCFEGRNEVYFCRISSGALWHAWGNAVDAWATPLGKFPIWRKLISLHMSGGSSGGGWDLPAIAWTSLFAENGVAIHSTFWHNNFGEPMSHGCVNASRMTPNGFSGRRLHRICFRSR